MSLADGTDANSSEYSRSTGRHSEPYVPVVRSMLYLQRVGGTDGITNIDDDALFATALYM